MRIGSDSSTGSGTARSSRSGWRRSPSATSILYSCAVSGGTATFTLNSRKPGNLRKQLGKRVKFGIYRAKKASRAKGKITVTFGW
ncbi:MAG: hypothetical protein H0W87_05460 [Actinobacteria bacterium]|nr:hypothetical protein [Actinomycetota bacterium]